MPQDMTTGWQKKLTTALKEDPRKTGFLGVLVAILLIVSGRMVTGTGSPSPVAGALFTPITSAAPALAPSPIQKPAGTSSSLRVWLSTPVPAISRNDFVVKSEYYQPDAAKKSDPPSESGFWATLEKSLSLKADQKEKREAEIANLKLEAAALRPTSTVMGSSPRAMVNGVLVGEGETVGSFCVERIEPRGIVVEREGIQLAIPMK